MVFVSLLDYASFCFYCLFALLLCSDSGFIFITLVSFQDAFCFFE